MAFNPNQLQLVASFERPGILFAMCYDRAAGTLYGAGTDGAVYSVDLDAEEPAATNKWEHHDNYVSSLVWVNGTIVSGGFDRRLIWTDAESGERSPRRRWRPPWPTRSTSRRCPLQHLRSPCPQEPP